MKLNFHCCDNIPFVYTGGKSPMRRGKGANKIQFPFAEDISAGFMGNKKKVLTKIRDAGSR